MKNFRILSTLLLFVILSPVSTMSAEMSWEGSYRIEGVGVYNSALNSNAKYQKSYFLHHLQLNPKIVAMDGVTLHGRVNIFNNSGQNGYGGFLGQDPDRGGIHGEMGSGTNAQNQKPENIQISQFYLKWATEFGALVAGRAPLHFGLGITHNAGTGLFDHFADTRDMVAYKVIAGNLYFLPMYAKVSEGGLGQEDDINDFMFQVQYDNPDTDLSLGLLYQVRVTTVGGNANDQTNGGVTPAGQPYGGAGATRSGNADLKTLNVFVNRNVGPLNIGFESSFANGRLGFRTSEDKEVVLDSYMLAFELGYKPTGKWSFDLKTGLATGDDPGTKDKYEGYFADRNYDLGWLLFNHKLGSYDVLGTKYARNSASEANGGSDQEYLSNAFYVAPGAKWQFSETWDFNTRLVWAQVQREQPIVANDDTVKNSLGIEWDLGLGYKPHENLVLDIGAAFLFPGDAFVGGQANYSKTFGYGLTTKAAVRF